MIGSLTELIRGIAQRFIWLGTQDIRLLYKDIGILKSSLRRKIEILEQLQVLEGQDVRIEKHIKKIAEQLMKFDKIFQAKTLRALQAIEKPPA
ncbi:MAG: hypothetical protein IH819_06715, partial [Bacteroidetes bacterium]|nr:hypothetical protein [Bacteroidota bacterium]